MPKRTLALALALAALVALPAQAGAKQTRAALPLKGVLVPGKSLGGIGLGFTQQQVLDRWGADFRACDSCDLPTWYYTYDAVDEHQLGLGAAVVFRAGRVVAVFTLGAPAGWRTSDGLQVGAMLTKANETYAALQWKPCIGYIAMTLRSQGAVTSIYTDGNSIYGFALTHRSQPVCQ